MTTGHRPDMTRLFGRYDGIDPIWRAKTKKAGEHIVSYSFITVFQWMNRRWGHRSAIGLKRITPFLFPMFHGTLKGWGSQLRLFKGNQTPDQKLRYTKTFPISWEWKNVSLHHSFAVSWTQLLIKCDYSVCNGKTVRSVRVKKVLVAHQETETLSAVTVLPIGNSRKIVSVSSHSFHASEGARQGHCQKYVLI